MADTQISTRNRIDVKFLTTTLSALLGFFVLIVSPAFAQLAPSRSGFSSAPTEASKAEYWIMIRKLGVCLADAKYDQSVTFLSANPGSVEEDRAFDSLFHRQHNRCMGNFVSASMLRSHVRGSVAEGLLNLMDDAELNRVAVVPPTMPESIHSMHDFAFCYAAAHPVTALQFLQQTSIGTKGEAEAICQMAPDFGECFPEEVAVEINPVNIRSALAEAFYRAVKSMPPAQVQDS